jgi:acetyl esterase/lipase
MTDMSRRDIGVAAIGMVAAGGTGPAAGYASTPQATATSDGDALQLPAQAIPVPTSVSSQGQGYLAAAARRSAASARPGAPPPPSQSAMAAAAVGFLKPQAAGFDGTVTTTILPSGAKLLQAMPQTLQGRRAEVAYIDIHGGGFTSGGGELCELLARIRAADYGTTVFAVDYRLAPEHTYPAALDDCVDAYKMVLAGHRAARIVVGGASAGGNLAAALMLRARAEKLPLPCALVLQTPGVDVSHSGDSFHTNRYLDTNLNGGGDGPSAYLGRHDPRDPLVSPVFGDVAGFPPTILTTGTRDLLLSDTVRMHRALRRAGVRAELHVSEASPHGGFMGAKAPEDQEIVDECRRFVFEAWGILA